MNIFLDILKYRFKENFKRLNFEKLKEQNN
jgi:hypothetical protein